MTRSLRFPSQTSEPDPIGSIAIRRATRGDAAAAVAAFNDVFGLQRSADYWTDKFEFAEEVFAFIAIDEGGTVFAQFAASPVTLRLGDTLLPVLNAADVFARRSPLAIRQRLFLRTQGVFHRHFQNEGRYTNIFAFPNEVSLNVSHHARPEIENVLLREYRIAEFLELPLWQRIRRTVWPVRLVSYTDFHPDFLKGVEAVWRRRSRLKTSREVDRSPNWARWRFDKMAKHYGAYGFHLVTVGGSCAAWFVTREMGASLIVVDWSLVDEELATYGHLAHALKQVADHHTAAELRVLASLPALAPFHACIVWKEIEGPIVPFGTMVYAGARLPVNELRLTFGDTDLR